VSITSQLTVSKLTPPGYFNLSSTADSHHKDYMSWFQQQLTWRAEQAESLAQMIITPWLATYNNYPRVPYLSYLLDEYGFGFFGGTNTQAAYLYRMVSGSWSHDTISNARSIIDAFCLAPFSWFETATIYAEPLIPSNVDTGFVVYSTAGSLPSAPASVAYTNRAWATPSGWTRTPSSATYYSRGYLSGSNILWCTPRAVSDFSNLVVFSASIPGSVASAGTLCIVNNDGTGDVGSVYYSDGTAWRKNSLSNVNLGLVATSGAPPIPEAVTVWAPNPSSVSYAITSATRPPADGATQGYGTFSGWSDTIITANTLEIILHQIAGGTIAIATLLAVLRRIKPATLKILVMIDGTPYYVSDARESA
jgi:hypothetical protein